MYRTGIRPIVDGAEVDVPLAGFVAGQALRYNANGTVDTVAISTGIAGPGVSVVGDVVTWNDVTGTTVADGGVALANLVRMGGTPVVGRIAQWSSNSPPTIVNGTLLSTEVVGCTTASIAIGNLPVSSAANGSRIIDSGIVATNVVQGATRVLFNNYTMTGALADVPAMSCTLPAAGSYSIRLIPIYEVHSSGTLGFAFSFSGTTLFYRMGGRYQVTVTGSQSNFVQLTVNTSYTSFASITAAAGNFMMAELEAVIVTNTAGTLQLRCETSGDADLLGGSAFTVTRA